MREGSDSIWAEDAGIQGAVGDFKSMRTVAATMEDNFKRLIEVGSVDTECRTGPELGLMEKSRISSRDTLCEDESWQRHSNEEEQLRSDVDDAHAENSQGRLEAKREHFSPKAHAEGYSIHGANKLSGSEFLRVGVPGGEESESLQGMYKAEVGSSAASPSSFKVRPDAQVCNRERARVCMR